MAQPAFHLVFLQQAVLVVRAPGLDWRALQAEFFDFRTALGPWTLDEVRAWLAEEYGPDPERERRLSAFAGATERVLSV